MKAEIWREGNKAGDLELTAEDMTLDSRDEDLRRILAGFWQDGMVALTGGPLSRKGVVDGVRTVKLGPASIGLLGCELRDRGYELRMRESRTGGK